MEFMASSWNFYRYDRGSRIQEWTPGGWIDIDPTLQHTAMALSEEDAITRLIQIANEAHVRYDRETAKDVLRQSVWPR